MEASERGERYWPIREMVGAMLLLYACARYGAYRNWTGQMGTPMGTRIWPFHLENWPWTNGVEWSARVFVSMATLSPALAATLFWLKARRRTLALLLLLAAAYGFHFALNMQRFGYPASLHRTFERGTEYWHDVPLVGRGFLAAFPEVDKLSMHGKAHPPGYTLFLYAVKQLGASSMHAAAVVCSLFTTVTALFLYGFARRRFDEQVARYALPLFLFACSVSAYTISLMDMLNMACAAMSLYGLALVLDGRRAGAALLGAGWAMATLCTLASVVLGIAYAVLLIASLERPLRWSALPWRSLAWAAAAFAAVYAVPMYFGYRPLHAALVLNRAYRTSLDSYRNYFRGYSGSPLAWVGALGFPLMGLTIHALGTAVEPWLRRRPPVGRPDPIRAMLLAACAPFYLCVILGKPRAEVEHIFMFLVPLLVLALAAAAVRWYRRGAAWVVAAVGLAMTQSIIIEIFLDTSW